MCKSKGSKDNSAAIAAQQEAARQARIAEGQTSIDSAFAGFDDPFFQGYNDQFTNYYSPQLDDQYKDAVKRLTLQLAQSGNLTGSVGAQQMADLQKFYDQQKLSITNQAQAATQQLRGNIDNRKSILYADNRAASDPGSAASAAASAVQALQPTAPTSPLAAVFGDFFNNLGNNAAISNATRLQQGTGVQSYGGKSGSGSVTTIGR